MQNGRPASNGCYNTMFLWKVAEKQEYLPLKKKIDVSGLQRLIEYADENENKKIK